MRSSGQVHSAGEEGPGWLVLSDARWTRGTPRPSTVADGPRTRVTSPPSAARDATRLLTDQARGASLPEALGRTAGCSAGARGRWRPFAAQGESGAPGRAALSGSGFDPTAVRDARRS